MNILQTTEMFLIAAVFVAIILASATVFLACVFIRRKRTEKALQESERMLSTLLENLPGMAYRCKNDEYWTMEFVSAGCKRLTGYAKEDLVGNKKIAFVDLKFAEDADHDREIVQDAIRRQDVFNLMYRIKTADNGIIKWVWEQGCGVFDDNGQLMVIEGFITDISDRKSVEEEIVKLNMELEERVMMRTRELQNTLEKLEEDEQAGKKIQQRLLPEQKVAYGNYEFSSYFQSSMYLSGDFIDYFIINDHHLAFYMADVSGHGVSSAFITVFLKSFFAQQRRNYSNNGDKVILDASKLIQQLNLEMIASDFDKHVTIFYGIIDTRDNTLTCANGGQFPFPVLVTDDNSSSIELKSNPVGLFEEAYFETKKIDLPQEFSLFLISDGTLEILQQNTLKEKTEYLLSILNTTRMSIADIRKQIRLDKRDEIPDDISFLKIEKKGIL